MDILSGLFLKILNMSVTASIVILVVILIRLLINKAPKGFSFMLWAVVAFRLICPFSFSSMISVFSPINYVASDISIIENADNVLTIPRINNIIENITKEEVLDENTGYISGVISQEEYNSTLNQSLPMNQNAADIKKQKLTVNITYTAAVTWMAMFIFISIYSVISFLKLKKCVSKAIRLEKNIFQSDKINSPFVLGVIKPKIYIPFGLDPMEKEYILAHENYHIKRLDPLTRIIYFIILSIHWFNPLVWLSFKLMTKDMEMSCDEKALSDKSYEIKRAYSMSLLSFASNKKFTLSPLAFGESNTKRRVMNVLNFKKPRIWAALLIFIVCIFITVACASNPKVSPNMATPIPTMDFSNPDETIEGLYIDKLNYSRGENTITVKFVNETGKEFLYGETFGLQLWEDGQWKNCEVSNIVNTIAYILGDNSEKYHKYTMPAAGFPLDSGKYRFTGSFIESDNKNINYAVNYDFDVLSSSIEPNKYIEPIIIGGSYNSELGDSGSKIFHDKESLMEFIGKYNINGGYPDLDTIINQKINFENKDVIICYSMDSLNIDQYADPVFSFETGGLKVFRRVFSKGTASFDFKLSGYMLIVSKTFTEKYEILADENVQYIVNYNTDNDITPTGAFEKSGAKIDSNGKVSVDGKTYSLGTEFPVFGLGSVDFVEVEGKYYFVYTFSYGSGVNGMGAGVFDISELKSTDKNSISISGPALFMREGNDKNYILYRCDEAGKRFTVGDITFKDGSYSINFIKE